MRRTSLKYFYSLWCELDGAITGYIIESGRKITYIQELKNKSYNVLLEGEEKTRNYSRSESVHIPNQILAR